jgi:aquaporin Z
MRGPRANFWRDGAAALQTHWPEYLMESAELCLFMISACCFTALFENPGSPALAIFPSPFLRRFLIGVAMSGTALALIYSPLGRRSGAHMNPAVTLTFFRLKTVKPWDAVFYLLAQFTGAIAGVGAASLAIHMAVAHPAVRFAATVPGERGPRIAFVSEAAISFVLLLTVLVVSNQRALARYTGFFVAALILAYITIEAPLSGMSMNPARTLGSAVYARIFDSLWIYFVAPVLGMLLAAEIYVHLHSAREIYCAKLNHRGREQCIFLCRYNELMQSETATSGQSESEIRKEKE